MYQTLAFHDDHDSTRDSQIFSLDGIRESKVETFRGYKTSRRTILVCSLILISTAGLLATWIFVARPRFYPKINIVARSLNPTTISNFYTSRKVGRHRRATIMSEITSQNNRFSVDLLTKQKDFPNKMIVAYQLIYYLKITIYIWILISNADNVTGSVKITFKCVQNTDQIIFHGRRIVLRNVNVSVDNKTVNYLSISYLKSSSYLLLNWMVI